MSNFLALDVDLLQDGKRKFVYLMCYRSPNMLVIVQTVTLGFLLEWSNSYKSANKKIK